MLLVSDIHGNNFALKKVLEKAGEAQRVVCLGDVAWDGPQPSEVLAELRKLSCPVVMGNTDEYLVGVEMERLEGRWKEMGKWYQSVLSEEDRELVRGFMPSVTLDLCDGLSALCYHGSPRSNRERIVSETPKEEIAIMFSGYPQKILVGGHTHHQMLRRFEDRLIVNPGSVGSPVELKGEKIARTPAWAEYAVIERTGEGLSVSLRRVDYDIRELEEATADSSMPDKDLWLDYWKRTRPLQGHPR